MTDSPSFEAPIDPAAGVRPPTNEEAQRAAEVLADNILGDQLSTDGFLFVRADQAISAMLDYAARQLDAVQCGLEKVPAKPAGEVETKLEAMAHAMAEGEEDTCFGMPEDGDAKRWLSEDLPRRQVWWMRARHAYHAAFATQRAMSQPKETWMSDPLSLDAGLPPTNQAGDADSLALIQRMANRETDPGGCLDIVSWLIEADRIAALAQDEAK